VLSSLSISSDALAQAGASDALDEIVVTARRREESLQVVPLAITAFSGEQLEAAGVEMIGNLNAMAPNLSVQGGSGRGIESSASFRVRGMPGVAVYVDGIDQTESVGLFTMGVLEVDRIEVLRGPQGTLFGNASLGGAIQYVTRRPGEEFGGRIQARTGSFNRREISASIDVPLTPNFLTKFTLADQNREGFMQSVDNGRKFGDINDQFARADLLFTPTDNLTLRYAYDKSTQDRAGGARAVWEIGPAATFDVGGVIVNSNAQAQAMENAYGIVFNDQQVVSGYPGGAVGEYETRVSHETNGFFIEQKRHTFDITYDINDNLTFRSLMGQRVTERRLMVDFDSDTRVDFSNRQDNDWVEENSQEFQLIGSFGDDEQFSWVVGVYMWDNEDRSRSPTFSNQTLTCDIWRGSQTPDYRGVTDLDRVNCFNDRMRALGVEDQFVAVAGDSAADIAAMWSQVIALNPNYLGVTPTTISGSNANTDALNITEHESEAIYADLSWNVTDKFTIALGMRRQEDKNLGTLRVRGVDIAEPFPWDNPQYVLASPHAYNRVSSTTAPTSFEDTTTRVSLQYQWTDDIMTYLTVANGYSPGGRSTAPTNVLNVNASGVAVGGFLRDVHNAGLSDLPAELLRGKQTVDSYELGLKADWLDGRLRSNLTYFTTDWRNMTGSTYVATIYWDTDADGFANIDGLIPCSVRCTGDGQYEILWFPNLLTSAVNKAEASGAEFELNYFAGDNFQLGANIGLLDSEFIDLGDAALGTVPAYAEGDKFAGAPDMTANIWGQYDWSLSNGASLTARLDYTWTDDYTTFAGGPLQRTQEAFGLVNARVTYDSGQNWSLVVAGTNLTEEYYSPAYFYTVSQQLWQGSVGRPREVYLGLNFTFD
jgi:iron complex outermembrane receptor protein